MLSWNSRKSVDFILNTRIETLDNIARVPRLCGLVVRDPGYRSKGSGSIPGTTIFSEE
jgi:hypothetical protein